ncbi:MAG: hypothetical protein RIR49_501, partial [Actinomycetota bacterium]
MKPVRLALATLALAGSVAFLSSVTMADDFPGVSTLDDRFNVRGPMVSDGAKVIFAGIDGNVNLGDHELWTSDGTVAGTSILKNINPSGSSNPIQITEFGDGWLFVADDGQTGFELWFTDGTADGTRLVKDINPGPGDSWPGKAGKSLSTGMRGDGLYVIDGVAYFWAFTAAGGGEPWKSDGTENGTVMIQDLVAGTNDGMQYAGPFLETENGVIFPSQNVVKSYDGSSVTTVTNLPIQYGLSGASVPGGALAVVSVYTGAGTELWVTDGTVAGSSKIRDGGIFASAQLGDVLLVDMQTATGFQLWKTDGTISGTQLVKDINASGYDGMLFLDTSDTHLLLLADDGVAGVEYWATDGTADGTQILGDLREGADGQFSGSIAGFSIPPSFVDD